MSSFTLCISIDTEEDDWGSYVSEGASTANILLLPRLQRLFDRWGARPTYLVNRPPLVNLESVEVLGRLAEQANVEIGAHCHPWNTPPFTGEGAERSMMNGLTEEENTRKIGEVCTLLSQTLGVEPKSFRAGRWGFGPTVAPGLAEHGFEVDCSVSPFIDWSGIGGPDYGKAPHRPYRFDPRSPFQPARHGALVELPTTVGFLAGHHRMANRVRRGVESSPLARIKVVGMLDRAGVMARRWLSPETSSGAEMVRLVDSWVGSGETFAQLTFHSCALLPGATPFVQDEGDQQRFLDAVEAVLRHCREIGCTFRTLLEAGREFRSSTSTVSVG